MGRTCTVCAHEKRAEIDAELVAGKPYRSIAEQYGCGATSLLRHRGHLPDRLARARDAAEVASADALICQLLEQRDRADRLAEAAETIMSRALAEGDTSTALDAIKAACAPMRELRGALDLIARVAGVLAGAEVEVNVNSGTVAFVQQNNLTVEDMKRALEIRDWMTLPLAERKRLMAVAMAELDAEQENVNHG